MTRMVLTLVFAMLASLAVPASLTADVLLIEEVRQAENMDVPENGMPSLEVRARFGDPVKIHAAVGDPPISRWEYDKWSVYFEYDLVLFTVLHKKEKTEAGAE